LDISLENLSKKYFKEWIFKNINYRFHSCQSYAIIGSNGSGKSTFLQILSGIIPATEGTINYRLNNSEISSEVVYRQLSIVAPYQGLIEELTLAELYKFHFSFKQPLDSNLTLELWLEKLNLIKESQKPIANFSSGMKQRVKLGLAFYTQNNLLLLDEPTSNLDQQGVAWYQSEIENVKKTTTLIICSKQPEEYLQCSNTIEMKQWK